MGQKDERWRKKDERYSREREWHVKEAGVVERTIGQFCLANALALYGLQQEVRRGSVGSRWKRVLIPVE